MSENEATTSPPTGDGETQELDLSDPGDVEVHDSDPHVTALIELSHDADFAHLLGEPEPPQPVEPEEEAEPEDLPAPESDSAPIRTSWMGIPTSGIRGLGVLAAGLVVVLGVLLGVVHAVKSGSSALSEDATATSSGAENGLSADTPETESLSVTTHPGVGTPTHVEGGVGSSKDGGDDAPGNPGSDGRKTHPAGGNTTQPQEPDTTAKPSTARTTQPAAGPADPVRATTSTASGPDYVTVGVIRNLMTGYCADLPGRTNSVAENVLVAQYTCDGGSNDNQVYQTVTQADGTFLLRNLKSGWCLDVDGGGSVAKGTAVNTHNCLLGSRDNQMFRRENHGNGFFLVHVKSGLCLNVSNPDGVDNKVLGLRLTLFPCSTNDDHVWTFG